jgi:two-component system response regulator YesN
METLSGVAHLSANYLGSLFKQEEGISVSRFIEKVRVDAAAVLLLSSNRKAGDIAKACGFRNTSYFGKCFRGIYGMSPTVFRENYQSSGIKRILGENGDVDDGN